MAKFGQVDSIHRFDVVPYIQLVTPREKYIFLLWKTDLMNQTKSFKLLFSNCKNFFPMHLDQNELIFLTEQKVAF